MIKIDSSPLIYAIKGNYISLLKNLYSDIVIIDSVYEEVVKSGINRGKRDAYVIEKLIETKELERHSDSEIEIQINLGKGESAVINSAKKENCIAFLEDQKARKIATNLGIKVEWTSYALLKALKVRLISDGEFDDFLNQYIIFASPSVLEIQTIKKFKELIK